MAKKNCGCSGSCNDCSKTTLYDDTCLEVVRDDCNSTPCPNGVLDTDCVFYNSDNTPINNLPNLGVKHSISLTKFIKHLDSKLGNSNLINVSQLNWCTSNPNEVNTSNLFNTLQFIITEACRQKGVDESILSTIEEILEDKAELWRVIGNMNYPGLSWSEGDINNSDDIRNILQKLITYLDEFECCENTHTIEKDIDVSSLDGNQLQKVQDGYYVGKTPANDILTEICNDDEVKTKFQELVKKTPIKQRFHISNRDASISQTINYVDVNGLNKVVNVAPNSTQTIGDVREITTLPTLSLNITYLGYVV